MQTIAGLTEWILCTIGLKQGCVLSPLLFALFIAELEKRIQELGIGVRVGGQKLGGLLFADDLVLMAENVGDLKRLVEVTDKFMHERKLEINVGKSASMRVGRKRAEGGQNQNNKRREGGGNGRGKCLQIPGRQVGK